MVNNIIQLDFTTEGIREKIYAVQTDTGRVLQCNIIGVDLNGVTARFYAVKESGKEIYNNCSISGNRVIIQLTEQTLAEVGIVNCQLDLRKNGEKVQSFIFNIQVTPSLMKGSSIVSSDEFKIFEELADDVAENKNKIMDLEDKKADKDQFGAPLVATVVADMTDKTRVYVYTGTEDGYISGNWYYYDGTAWTSGGVYNSQGIGAGSITLEMLSNEAKEEFKTVDKTLTLENTAADAKSVGDAIEKLKASGSGLNNTAINLLISILKSALYSTNQSKNINDLEIALSGMVYSITYNLINVTINNTSSVAKEDSSYTAMLTATDGYELDSITVIMGDVDITSTVCAGGDINITSVTDDIVITANAGKIGNLIKLSKCISDGSVMPDGRQVTAGVKYVTPFIETIEDATYYTNLNQKLSDGTTSTPYVYTYDSDKKYVRARQVYTSHDVGTVYQYPVLQNDETYIRIFFDIKNENPYFGLDSEV